MDGFYELLHNIKERPGMYLGKKSLECLSHFVNGYVFCLWDQGSRYSHPGFIPGFQEYVQKEYNVAFSQRWDTIIGFHSTSDEEAFDTFFDLWDKYSAGLRCSSDVRPLVMFARLKVPAGMGVTWTSSDPKIATVGDYGEVTPVGPGTCTITVATDDGSKTATCTLKVSIPVTCVSLGLTLAKNATLQLTSAVSPDSAANKKVTWSTDEPTVATVDATGKVTAVAVGTAIITVTTEDGGKTAACMITVTEAES